NLELARSQIEEQVDAIRGQMEMARASLNTVRQQLTSGSTANRGTEMPPPTRPGPLPRVNIPPLSPSADANRDDVVSPTLNDLRAAVDALKRPVRPETPSNSESDDTLASPPPEP